MSESKRHGPEKLRVFQLSLQLAEELAAAIRASGCYDSLAVQGVRASDSVTLNIAEGSGHFTPGRKANHYRIALASVEEVLGALYRMERLRSTVQAKAAIRTAHMTAAMLTKLIKTQTDRATTSDTPE